MAIDVVETRGPGDASDIARREWAGGRRSFIGCGGDGTTFEILNGLFPAAARSDEKPVIGFLPLGTGNSFLRDFTEGRPWCHVDVAGTAMQGDHASGFGVRLAADVAARVARRT